MPMAVISFTLHTLRARISINRFSNCFVSLVESFLVPIIVPYGLQEGVSFSIEGKKKKLSKNVTSLLLKFRSARAPIDIICKVACGGPPKKATHIKMTKSCELTTVWCGWRRVVSQLSFKPKPHTHISCPNKLS